MELSSKTQYLRLDLNGFLLNSSSIIANTILKFNHMELSESNNPSPSLYERLGGEVIVRKFVNDVLEKNSNNPLIGHYFENIDMENLKRLVFEFFSMGTGGPHQYTGRDLPASHVHLKISEEDFEIANQDTLKAMAENGIGLMEQKEVLAILNSLKGDVVKE